MPEHTRIGTGYDIHRLVAGRKLVLGGVHIPHDKGSLGHSDGDALSHAIADALLGAASLGDLGLYFPDNDPQFKDASSIDLLSQVARLLESRKCSIENIDSTVILQSPRLAPFIHPMRARLAKTLAIPEERVSIKAKSNEGLGDAGRGEAVMVHAVCTIRSRARASPDKGQPDDRGTVEAAVAASVRPTARSLAFVLLAAAVVIFASHFGAAVGWEKSLWMGILVLLLAVVVFLASALLAFVRLYNSAKRDD